MKRGYKIFLMKVVLGLLYISFEQQSILKQKVVRHEMDKADPDDGGQDE